MHKVLRTFTDGVGRVQVGSIVDGSRYRNLGFLIRTGRLQPVGDHEEPTPREIPEVIEETVEEIIETPVEEAKDELEAESEVEEPLIEPVTFRNNDDIIDQLANIPEHVETKPAPKKAAAKPAKRK